MADEMIVRRNGILVRISQFAKAATPDAMERIRRYDEVTCKPPGQRWERVDVAALERGIEEQRYRDKVAAQKRGRPRSACLYCHANLSNRNASGLCITCFWRAVADLRTRSITREMAEKWVAGPNGA